MCRSGERLRYKNAPILEAVLAFDWTPQKPLAELEAVLESTAFESFEKPKKRFQLEADFDIEANAVSQRQHQLGFQTTLRDGSEIAILEQGRFAFVQPAPYDRWDYFVKRALALLVPTVSALAVLEFARVGLRFVNRIDIPNDGRPGVDTNKYFKVKFDGPRRDRREIEEFQMRVVKPTKKEGLAYALVLATTPSPLPDHSAILLDIDVFTRGALPSSGTKLIERLGEMRREKNDIFEKCLTDQARALFGGVEE